jgi:hypothetical protein
MRAERQRARRAWIAGLFLSAACSSPTPPVLPAAAAAAPSSPALRYRLDLPSGWSRRPDREANQADTYAESDGGRSWLVVRSTSGTAIRLDDLVAFRRNAIFGTNRVSEFREKRTYQRNAAHVPVSISRYLVGSEVILVMAAVDGSPGVECVAGTPLGVGRERELLAFFETLRFLDQVPR